MIMNQMVLIAGEGIRKAIEQQSKDGKELDQEIETLQESTVEMPKAEYDAISNLLNFPTAKIKILPNSYDPAMIKTEHVKPCLVAKDPRVKDYLEAELDGVPQDEKEEMEDILLDNLRTQILAIQALATVCSEYDRKMKLYDDPSKFHSGIERKDKSEIAFGTGSVLRGGVTADLKTAATSR